HRVDAGRGRLELARDADAEPRERAELHGLRIPVHQTVVNEDSLDVLSSFRTIRCQDRDGPCSSGTAATKIPQLVHSCDQKNDNQAKPRWTCFQVVARGRKLVRTSQYPPTVRRSKRIAWWKRPRNQGRRKPAPRVRPGTLYGGGRLARAGQVARW